MNHVSHCSSVGKVNTSKFQILGFCHRSRLLLILTTKFTYSNKMLLAARNLVRRLKSSAAVAASVAPISVKQHVPMLESEEPLKEMNFLESVLYNFDQAAKFTGISREMLSVIRSVDASLKLTIPLKREDGSMEYYAAYRA